MNILQVDYRDTTWPAAMQKLSRAGSETSNGDVIEFLTNDLVVHEAAKEWCRGKGEIVRTRVGHSC